MRPTSFLLLVSSVCLVANAIPIPVRFVPSNTTALLTYGLYIQVDTSELTTIHERDVVEVDLADVDHRDLDEVSERTELWIHKADLFF